MNTKLTLTLVAVVVVVGILGLAILGAIDLLKGGLG